MRPLLLVVVAGCWSSSSPPVAAPKLAALPPLPACPIELVDQHLRVAGADLGEFLDEPEATTHRLAIYQTGDEAWVSYVAAQQYRGPAGSDTMWKVSCGGSKLDQLTIAGADFGHAALHPDRKRLFFSSEDVVIELDLATKAQTKITKPSTIEHCWIAPDDNPFPLRDSVTRVTADFVEFERGNSCGFEADWEATGVRYHFATKREELATSISSAAQTGTAVLVSVEKHCNSQVLRSTDWKTWTQVPVDLVGPVTLIADGSTVLAVSGACGYGGGGSAAISRDGGMTWKAVEGVENVQAIRGTTLASLELVSQAGELWQRWDGTSFVATTKRDSEETPSRKPTATLLGRTVELTGFGLIDATTREKLYPRN